MTPRGPGAGYRDTLAEAGAYLAGAVTHLAPEGAAAFWREWQAAAKVAEAAAVAIDPGHPAAARFADLVDLAEAIALAIDDADGVTR